MPSRTIIIDASTANLHSALSHRKTQMLPTLLAPLQQLLQVLLAQDSDVFQALHNLLRGASKGARLPAEARGENHFSVVSENTHRILVL
jgi:hypothetical protein